MAFVSLANVLVLLQLSLLLCSSITVYGDVHSPPAEDPHPPHHDQNHPPTPTTPPPVKPRAHPPVKPPVKPPVHPPVKPPPSPKKKVAVQGVVYCKSCKYRGIDTLLKASPLAGAVVKLQCNNAKYPLVDQTKTDKNGYFFFMPPTLTKSDSHKCKVFLVSSPLAMCSVPTNLHGGIVGTILIPSPKPPVATVPYELFTVGPFAFEPPKKLPCHY